MKLLLIALTLTPVAALSSNSAQFLAEFGPSHDAGSVMAKLTNLMGSSQQKLALAERHHKKTVKKIRKEAEAFLQDESSIYGNYIRNYSAELNKATDDLESAVQAAKEGLAKAEAAPSNPNDWKDPDVEQRAKLGAQVAAAERTVKRSERRSSRQVREAEERGEETMEDESSKLAMKLGDMTPLVDEAKKSLESVAEKVATTVVAAGKTTKPSATATTSSKKEKVDIKALEDKLVKATKASQTVTAEANKRLEGFLVKTDKDIATKATKIQKDLETEQKAEIEKVLGKKVEAAPVKKVEKAKAIAVPAKKVEKVVPAKKVEKVVAKAAPVKPAPASKPVTKPVPKVDATPAVKPAAVAKK